MGPLCLSPVYSDVFPWIEGKLLSCIKKIILITPITVCYNFYFGDVNTLLRPYVLPIWI